MSEKITAAPPLLKETLIVQDALGNIREYDLAAMRERFVPEDVPDHDVLRFAMICRAAGADPVMSEAQILPFKDRTGKTEGVPYLTAAYYERRAAEHPDFAGMKAWPVDENEEPVPTTTTDPARVAGAICEVYRHSWAVPLREVVAVEEVIRRYPKTGDPIGDFWANPHKRIHQIKKVAIRRALAKAFPISQQAAAIFEQHKHELVEVTMDEPTEADAALGDAIDAEFEPVEESETDTGATLSPEAADKFRKHLRTFEGTDEEKTALQAGYNDLLKLFGVRKLEQVPASAEKQLYEWAAQAGIPGPQPKGTVEPSTEDERAEQFFALREEAEALGIPTEGLDTAEALAAEIVKVRLAKDDNSLFEEDDQ